MGVILKDYGRKFHLKFVDGTEKTYDASELDFYRLDEDEYGVGGGIGVIVIQKPFRNGKFQDDIAKENITEIFNNVSFRKFGNEFRKHIMPGFTQENNSSRLTPNYRWSDFASYIIGDGSYYVTEDEYNNFIKNFNTTYDDKFKDGGDVRDYEWYQGFKIIPNAPKPAHYTAIADLGTRKIKRHLDNRREVDEFLNEMSDREAISVELSKFTEQGLTRTVKFDWTGGEWELVSDETVEKKNSKKEG
jgi:hypothetical protein